MTIPDLYALLERLAANADEQRRFRDAKEIKDGMEALYNLKCIPADSTIEDLAKSDRGTERGNWWVSA